MRTRRAYWRLVALSGSRGAELRRHGQPRQQCGNGAAAKAIGSRAIGNPILEATSCASPVCAADLRDDVVVDRSATVFRVQRYATGRGARRSLLHLDQGTTRRLSRLWR
jgi:hypothetical protein